jgi:hypothetical protein
MMLCYLITFVFILYLPIKSLAIECFTCSQKLQFGSSDVLNTTRPDCNKVNALGELCFASLNARFDYKIASVDFSHVPEELMILSNAIRFTLNSTTIWFKKEAMLYSAQFFCVDSAVCAQDMNETYNRSTFDKYKHK